MVARKLGVAVFVFEEGYVRPYYITVEPGGVNGNSALSREPDDYASYGNHKPEEPQTVGSCFWPVVGFVLCYYMASWWTRRRYPNYRHHRSLNPFSEFLRWTRSGLKKMYYVWADRPLVHRLSKSAGQYYLVPLQVHFDAQIKHHAPDYSVTGFIESVVHSFAAHAPADTKLIFKHHPMDRAYRNYSRMIRYVAKDYGVSDRVHYLYEGHLPKLTKGARGTVTLNSTVGLSSAFHGTPVKTLGKAVYDMPGLTAQVPLADFWQSPGTVDRDLYRRFRDYLVANVLGNGSFYRRVRSDRGATGVAWPLGSLSQTCDPARMVTIPAAVASQKVESPVPGAATAEVNGELHPKVVAYARRNADGGFGTRELH